MVPIGHLIFYNDSENVDFHSDLQEKNEKMILNLNRERKTHL